MGRPRRYIRRLILERHRLPNIFILHSWVGPLVWAVLYISDYTFTLTCARMYQNGIREKISFEGSFELNPHFEKDIDSLRTLSPRFLLALAMTSLYLFGVWALFAKTAPDIYAFVLGAMVLIQLAIHMRHLRNFFIFREARTDAVLGRIEYSRKAVLWMSCTEMLAFAGLFSTIAALTDSWFMCGGAVACLVLAGKHWRLARKLVPLTDKMQTS